MPKIVTEEERAQVRDAIYAATIAVIRQKGMRKVTVDDIVGGVGISKGAFYSYYSSKEICVFEVLKRSEAQQFARLEEIMAQGLHDRDSVVACLREVFLAPTSLFLVMTATDLEALLRKLPPEYREREQKKSNDFFKRSLDLMKIDESKMETVALMTDCLGVVASDTMFSEQGKQQALDLLVHATADYLVEEGVQ